MYEHHRLTIPNTGGDSEMLHDRTKMKQGSLEVEGTSCNMSAQDGAKGGQEGKEMDNLRITLLHPAA